MKTAVLISNRRLDETHGRSETFRSRKNQLKEYGWDVKTCYVDAGRGPGPAPTLGAVKRCYRMVKKYNADIIHSVSEPVQLHMVGLAASKLTLTPWLVEFRDPLVTKPSINPDSKRASFRRGMERVILSTATKVVWVDGIQLPMGYFEQEYPSVPKSRYNSIQGHGIDLGLLDSIQPVKNEEFTLSYAGSFYGDWIKPDTYLTGVKEYMDRYDDRRINLQFFGDWRPEYQHHADKLGIGDHITAIDWVDPVDLLDELAGSDGLVYIGGDDHQNAMNIPSKLYDYFAAQEPILGVVDPSFRSAEFIKANNAGIIVPQEPVEIAEAIHRIKAEDVPSASNESLEKNSREKAVSSLLEAYSETIDQY